MVRNIVAAFALAAVAAIAVVSISEPIVLVGKVEHTFVPVEFSPAIWR